MSSTSVKNRILQFQTQSRADLSAKSSVTNHQSKSHNNHNGFGNSVHSISSSTSASPYSTNNSSPSLSLSNANNNNNNNHLDSINHSDELNGFQFSSISNNTFLTNTNNNNNKLHKGRSAFGKMSSHLRSPSPNKNYVQPNPSTLQAKKASMTINLSTNISSSNPNTNGTSPTSVLTSPTANVITSTTTTNHPPRAKPRTPTKNPSFSAIPKLTQNNSAGVTLRAPNSNSVIRVGGMSITNNSPSSTTTPSIQYKVQRTHTSPNIIHNANRSNSTLQKSSLSPATPTATNVGFGSSTSTGRFYGSIGWKEKYEESEKKRNHVVTLAQKATRDYEELRRRFQCLYSEHESLLHKFESATTQLDSLRKASEAAYDEYYKLKKKYEVENNAKSEALSRVDQYNKENRRLKRASALMMQQISDPTSFTDSVIQEASEVDSPDNDKEIVYLRGRVQELEARIIDLDSQLETIKLAEFETQESVIEMVQSSKSENSRLTAQLSKLDEENRRLQRTLDDTIVEFESLKRKYNDDEEKLLVAETELKKLLNEKNILQRQSMVFLSDAMDNRLLDALNQIGDLQTALEEQKNCSEAQIMELRNQLQEREYQEESCTMQTGEKVKSLEEEIEKLRQRAMEAERKLEEQPIPGPCSLPPPPPPPPMPNFVTGPPPPPMPSSTSLNSSLGSTMRNLRRVSTSGSNSDAASASSTPPNGLEGPKSLVPTPPIDDVISQLKKGIKLRPTSDRTLSKKQSEVSEKQSDSAGFENLRHALSNLKRTQILNINS